MKLYMAPPLWLTLGFLLGWVYCRPGLVIGVIWGAANLATVIWIMRDVELRRLAQPIEPGDA